ncbi:MAG: transcription-repair coupling factor [Proteobacteria bacterium]|nr:transcription-repair coupling factor [Pseudomonadota bacterium]
MFDLKETGFIYVTGKIGSFISFLLSSARSARRKTVVFYDSEDEALLLKEEIEFFSKKDICLFPLYTDRVFEKEDETKRISFLSHLVSEDDFIGLYPYSAIKHPLTAPEAIKDNTKDLQFGDTVFQEELIDYLDANGYELASLVREEGEYAKRGSIIDVYSLSYAKPVRIEFLGDQILSLRYFDTITQRSGHEVEKASLSPAKIIKNNNVTLLDYFRGKMVFVHKGLDYIIHILEEGGDNTFPAERLTETLLSNLNIDVSGVHGEDEDDVIEALSNEDLRHLFEMNKTEIFKILSEKLRIGWNTYRYVYVFANNLRQGERLKEIFRNYDISLPVLEEISCDRKEREWGIVIGPLRRGFRAKDIIVLTEEDITGPKKRAVKKKWDGFDEFLNSFKDLNVGEWVVHIEHGIGVYKGIMHLSIGGFAKDFLLLEYQDGDRLYVPIDDLRLVQKYIGGEKQKPKIDKLGAHYWRNTKGKVKRYVEDIAKELLEMYAERELAEGYAYPHEDELFREMESRFEYEETEGQSQAIEDVLNDLKRLKPMDRLICGDVGFGKTEVAIRASFKVVMENRQVAILVPTTILAQQHYKTFCERFKDYPLNVQMLSRFRSKEEQKKIVEEIRKGIIDVIIGTHRLLQKDLLFKDLGLLIIDEEHRFGVTHKEKLRQMKKNIDVLTLSATPIPRTLYMATSGIRDLSIINTPPLDRFAVKTYVVKFKDDLIKKAVWNELQRGGQVFFVHNYIHNIGVIYEHIKRLLPDVRIAVAHGKMEGSKLEKIMLDFIDKRYDILLSTNIIESGLDIANVNTIFINNAHRLGLADLYQLRGRVGRSTRQAYAYLLVPKDEVLTRDATLRLKIIEEMTGLGAGFHIANYDLEIRGAGNLLGKEQSGNINLIGFELYCNMLEEAIGELKNKVETIEEEFVTEINIPVDAFIPDTYMEEPSQKLLTYKRLSKIRETDALEDITEELKDRYGDVPKPLKNLLEVISLKIFLSKLKVRKVEHSAKQLVFHVTEHTPLNMNRILKLVKGDGNRIKLLPDGRIIMETDKKAEELILLTRNVLMEIVSI